MFIALSVSPDSKQLAYVASIFPGYASYIATTPAAGGPSLELFRDASWLDATRYGTLSWTPDQRFVMFAKGGVSDATPNVIWRVPAMGGPAEQVGLSVNGRIKVPQVDPSGRRLLFSMVDTTPEELWVLENFLPR
jgi:Tol biopolymer transport system component